MLHPVADEAGCLENLVLGPVQVSTEAASLLPLLERAGLARFLSAAPRELRLVSGFAHPVGSIRPPLGECSTESEKVETGSNRLADGDSWRQLPVFSDGASKIERTVSVSPRREAYLLPLLFMLGI